MVKKQASTLATTATPNQANPNNQITQRIEQYSSLREQLIDFVLNAEGEVATALESFSAQQLSRWAKPALSGLNRTDLAVDLFLSEGRVGDRTVIDLYLREKLAAATVTTADPQQWAKAFVGLFVATSVTAKSYGLTNWMTEKEYSVYADATQPIEITDRINPGEIVLARLLPIDEDIWMFSGPLTLLGKLGKPKLAVAIGNFKKWFPQHLYGDAPDLKEAAWESVEQQYSDFVNLFGGEQVTLSGYELNKKFQIYQTSKTEKQLAEAGLDSSKSIAEMATAAGVSAEEVAAAMDDLGEASVAAKKLMESGRSLKMVMPKASLPDEFRSAKSVSVFLHPRWGQTLLTDYSQLEAKLLAGDDTDEATAAIDRLIKKYLESEQVNAHVWQCLAIAQPKPVEASLRRVLNQPEFDIEQDLISAIAKYGKSLTPELPESASVPVHLHNLFQEALQAVGKGTQPKGSGKKTKAKKNTGFGA